MGTLTNPRSVILFTSIIFRNPGLPDKTENKIKEAVGDILDKTDSIPFRYTDYYEKEMGNNLSRFFLLFEPLFQRELLPEIKLRTNNIETVFSSEGKRLVNLDPGYISLENIVLATTKGYSHRIYLDHGIYADLTLIFRNGTYKPLEWTYPDYGSEETIGIFNRWRSILKGKTTKHKIR